MPVMPPSTDGGITTSVWPRSLVAQCGRLCERLRFKRTPNTSARAHALIPAYHSGLFDLPIGILPEVDDPESRVRDPNYEDIPHTALAFDRWKVVAYDIWQRAEDISVLESRALLRSMRRACSSRKAFRSR